MKKDRIVPAFALPLVAGLIATGAAVALAAERAPLASRVRGLLADLIPASIASTAGRASRLQAAGERVRVQRAEGQTSYLSLRGDGEAVATEYVAGTGVGELAGGARAHALASADFDGDGVPDLVSGYAGASGAGVVTLQRGNADAVYPNSPEARGRRASGEFTGAPFHAEAGAYSVPEAAHFVGAGDFDADGHWDAVAARRGGSNLYFLRGDGHGSFAAAERVELPGELTALATGEMNRPDGLTDIVVGVSGEAGAGVLVFESPAGALRGRPEMLPLPAAASGLALGALDAHSAANDLAIAAGNELLVIHGRDRRLSVEESSRGGVPEAKVSRSAFEFALAAVAVGDFAGDERSDVAVLSTDGALQVLTRAGGGERAKAEGTMKATARAEQAGEATGGAVEWRRSELTGGIAAGGATEGVGETSLLLAAKMSGMAKDDLLVLGGGRAHVVTNEAAVVKAEERRKPGKAESHEVEAFEPAAELRVSASVGAEGGLAAALPMRLSPSALNSLVVLGNESKAPSVIIPQAAVTFTVNSAANTNDATAGDGTCADANGSCTLAAATQEVNANANPGPYTINFNIPGAGVPVIITNTFALGNPIGKPVIIDGTTQPAGRVEVRSNFRLLFRIWGGNSTIRGLVISGTGAGGTAIEIASAGNNIIEGNYIGTNADGSAVAAAPNETGIYVETSNNRIGGTTAAARNVISGATARGVQILAGSGNLIQGNYIGTNAAGTAPIGNGYAGILSSAPGVTVGGTAPGAGNLISGNKDGGGEAALYVGNSATGVAFATVQGNLLGTNFSGDAPIGNIGLALFVSSRGGVSTIGGTSPAARNVISGNGGRGIYITACCDPNLNPSAYIQGNYIGTSADGSVAMPNLGDGILLDRAAIAVGGTAPGAGNLISGNGGDGINVSGRDNSQNHIIQGNLIGTDVSGTIALPNQGDGIETFGADNTLIGGKTPEARNVISGNRENGLTLQGVAAPATSPLRVEGNYIGANRFGTGALGNGRHGVFTSGSTEGNHIGGAAAGAGNLIAFNTKSGVASDRGWITGPVISNSIHSNGELGIDVGGNGVSPVSNESDANRPEVLSVSNTAAGTVVTGRISNYRSLEPFTIQFFSNPSCDPSGYGEGRTLVGQVSVPAPTLATYFDFSATISPAVPGGTSITAVNIRAANPFRPNNILYTSEFSNCARLAAPPPTPTPTPTATPTPTPAPLQLFAVAPNRGGDNGSVTSRISGQAFQEGATVRLVRPGQTDIAGGDVGLDQGGSILIVTFDLKGKARGTWDVVVTNPDGGRGVLPAAFTVEEGREPRTWVDIIGRDTARPGREQIWLILYGNRGNVDANGVMLAVSIPPDTTYTVGSKVGAASPSEVVDPDHKIFPAGIDWSQHPDYLESDEEKLIPFAIPIVPAGATGVIQLRVTFPSREGSFELQAMISDPFLESSPGPAGAATSSGSVRAKASEGPGASFEDPLATARRYRKWVNEKLEQNYVKPDGSIDFDRLNAEQAKAKSDYEVAQDRALNNGSNESLVALQRAKERYDRTSEHLTFARMAELARATFNAAKGAKDFVGKTGEEVIDGIKKWGQDLILEPVKRELEQTKRELIRDFKHRIWPEIKRLPGRLRRAFDPNEKIGARGAGAGRFISGEEPLRYAVFFENIETATAAAQDVIITDQLDVSKFDLSTFQLGPIGFGAHLVEPPPGLSEWATDVDLRPANDLIVRVSAKLDKATGVVTWKLISLDPATMLPTDDPLAGFLPPNKTSPEGEGSVVFTVSPKAELQTGAEIRNGARIFFDTNDPIDTPVWLNTIDNSKPASQVGPLAAVQAAARFEVRWSGADTGAGVRGYYIYVSENDGPFRLWLENTAATSANYEGRIDTRYRFYSVAADGADNLEDAPASADASTATPNISVQFNAASLTLNEGEGANGARLVVTRTGDTTGTTAVRYATVDDPAVVRCDARGTVAYARCDYATTIDTVTFAPGETQKTVVIPLIDDAHVEDAETFSVVLSNLTGGGILGAAQTVVVTVQDNDAAGAANPLDGHDFFVRMHYLDFLSREPEPSGLAAWVGVLERCPDVNNDPSCDRVTVSSGFFRTAEFELKGLYAYLFYRAAFNRRPDYAEIIPDMRSVTGQTPEEVFAKQSAFADSFAARQEFRNLYDSLSDAAFVDALLSRYGLASITTADPSSPDAGAQIVLSRQQLVERLGGTGGRLTRAQVLRAVVQSREVNAAEYNGAFVAMQYYGYLRRAPEESGYRAWLRHLNANPADFRTMVNGFVNSVEYRLRFGQP